MKENLSISKGLIVAEAVMMGMAPDFGRSQAHDVVYDACSVVNETGGTLTEVVAALPAGTRHFDHATIGRLAEPENYLGLAPQMLDRALTLSSLLP